MNKKALSLFVTSAMVLSMVPAVCAADAVEDTTPVSSGIAVLADDVGENTTGKNTTGNNTTGNNTTGNNTTGNNTTGNNTTGNNTTGNNTTGNNTTGNNTTGNNTTGNNTTGNNTTGNNTTGNNTTGNNTTGNNTTGNNTTGGNTSGGNTSGGNTSGGNTSGGNTSGGNTSGDNTTGDNTTDDNTTDDVVIDGGSNSGNSGGSSSSSSSSSSTTTVTTPVFTDVPAGAYYADAVAWAIKNGITAGTSDTTFSPDAPCTRAQIITFLWKASGSPAPKGTAMPFEDVAADDYFRNAVLWAVENGITSGTSDTTFSPDGICTRAQIVTFLHHAMKSSNTNTNSRFDDVAEDAYYAGPVAWAAENGITSGTSDTTFSPDATCTRAHGVTFLYKAMVK